MIDFNTVHTFTLKKLVGNVSVCLCWCNTHQIESFVRLCSFFVCNPSFTASCQKRSCSMNSTHFVLFHCNVLPSLLISYFCVILSKWFQDISNCVFHTQCHCTAGTFDTQVLLMQPSSFECFFRIQQFLFLIMSVCVLSSLLCFFAIFQFPCRLVCIFTL